jgi:peroxiredoxin-like protein
MSQIHPYGVAVEWSGGRGGSGNVRGQGSGVQLPLNVPAEFGGTSGGGTNPEELLACAVAACYTITFGIIAENRKIPVKSVRAEATGEVEQAGMQFTYKAIKIKPEIVLDASATDEQLALAEDMSHKADLYCIITNAVRDKVAISVEPSISRS